MNERKKPAVNRLLTAWLLALALIFLIEFAIWCFSPVFSEIEQPGDIVTFLPETAAPTNAIIASDNQYTPTDSDPQLLFSFTDQEIASVVVHLGEKADYSGNVQLYYAGPENPLSEGYSVVQRMYWGDSSLAFNIPKGQYNLLRLDIDMPVLLDSVTISSTAAVISTQSYILNFLRIALEVLALFVVFVLLLRVKRIRLFFDSLDQTRLRLFSIICFVFSYIFYREIKDAIAVEISVKVFVLVIHLIVLVLIALMMQSLGKNKHSLEKLFVIIALPLAIVYMFVITPLAVPDEVHHYQSSYELSNYMMARFNDSQYGDSRDFDYHGLSRHYNTLSGYERLVSEFFSREQEGETIEIPRPRSLSYPLMYLPQALALVIGRLFGAGFLPLFYLGRFLNILFYCLCAYLAIKLVPKQKPLFFALSLLPMALHQAASYSYDAFVNGMILLYIALIVRAFTLESKMGLKEYLALLNVGMLIVPAKVVHGLIILLAFLIPGKRFENKKQHIMAILGLWAAALVWLLIWWLPQLIRGGSVLKRNGGELYSVSFLLHSPLTAVDMVVNTLKDNIVFWTSSAIGYSLAGLTLWIPQYISIVYLFLLFALAVRTENTNVKSFSSSHRALLLVIALACTLLSMIYMMITWTFTSSRLIEGFQGRYLIPVLPLVYLALEGKSITRKESLDKPLLFSALLLNAITIYNILSYTLYH